MKLQEVEEMLLSGGAIDERKIYTYATDNSKFSLVGGAIGAAMRMRIICVANDRFSIYTAKMNNEAGELVYQCKLSDMQNLKLKTGLLGAKLSFNTADGKFKFENFKNGKLFEAPFREAGLI